MEVEERAGDHSRKVRVTNVNGALDYRWSIDGRTGFDVDKDRWLSDALLAIERRTAWLAKTRVPLLLKQGGTDAVVINDLRDVPILARSSYQVYSTAVYQSSALHNFTLEYDTVESVATCDLGEANVGERVEGDVQAP